MWQMEEVLWWQIVIRRWFSGLMGVVFSAKKMSWFWEMEMVMEMLCCWSAERYLNTLIHACITTNKFYMHACINLNVFDIWHGNLDGLTDSKWWWCFDSDHLFQIYSNLYRAKLVNTVGLSISSEIKKVIFKILNNIVWYNFKFVIFDLNYEINMFEMEKILFSQNYGLEERIGENHCWETLVSNKRTWFTKTGNASGIVNPNMDLEI